MESKIPKFDKLLDEIFDNLVPHTRTCKWQAKHKHCEGEFKIDEGDIKFLKQLRVPPPNFCPTCRRMRRMVYMNYVRLSKRKCDASGHQEMMISILPEECPFPVYDYHYFTGDEFDPMSFGIEYDFSKNPIENAFSLRKNFPMPSFLNRDPSSVNSEYSNGGKNLKNGYFVFTCHDVENAWYSNIIMKSRNVMDCYWVTDSEFVYQGVFSEHLYQCSFAYFSGNCSDCVFIFDCRNCSDCFGCVNLRNKNFCIFNEQYTKEEYEKFMKSIYPLTKKKLAEYEKKFWELVGQLPMNGTRNFAISNVFGSNIRNSKNLYDVTDGDKSENIRHSDAVIGAKDSMDITFTGDDSSVLYMGVNIATANRIKFSISTKFSNDCEFIFNSRNLSNCFMCFGIQQKSYCILNKQYTKEEYYEMLDKIKSTMLEKGEYADGPGMEFSAQAYNFSVAQASFPLTSEEVISIGGYIAKEPESNAGEIESLSKNELPKTIEETTNDILNKAIKCEMTGRPFRIILSELEFYRRMKIPLPSIHPSVRMEERIKIPANGKMYKTNCAKCGKEIVSMFNPNQNNIFYCEDCFKREIY